MSYILIIVAVQEEALQELQWPDVQKFATALGYNRHYPAALLHAPMHMG